MSNVILEEEMRYGISALDIAHKQFAENDELLVHGNDGKMYYKRANDGQLVTYDSKELTKQELISELRAALSNTSKIDTTDDDYLVYHTLDIAGKTNLLDGKSYDLNITEEFNVSKIESCLAVKIRGNSDLNSAISFIENAYNSMIPSNTVKSISCIFDVTEKGTGVKKEYKVQGDFNDMIILSLTPSASTVTGYTVKLKSISFPLLKNAYLSFSEEQKKTLIALNNGNTKFECDKIDLITYSDDISNPTLYNNEDGVKLQIIIPMKEINREYIDSEAFIVSEEKPTHKCIWGRILK